MKIHYSLFNFFRHVSRNNLLISIFLLFFLLATPILEAKSSCDTPKQGPPGPAGPTGAGATGMTGATGSTGATGA